MVYISVEPKINVPFHLRHLLTCLPGEILRLRFGYTGQPKPTIEWDKDGRDIKGPRYEIKTTDKESVLIIYKVAKEDAGKYTMVATNSLGHDTASIEIQILSKYCVLCF